MIAASSGTGGLWLGTIQYEQDKFSYQKKQPNGASDSSHSSPGSLQVHLLPSLLEEADGDSELKLGIKGNALALFVPFG